MKRRALAAAAALVACSLGPGSRALSAQYLSAYKAGLDAVEAKDWSRATTSFEKAIAERAEEKMKLPVKLFLRPYVPHFYLGFARFESGDCAGALAAWAESERQGVAPRLPEFDRARRGRLECDQRARNRALGQARAEAQSALARSTAAVAALDERSRDAATKEIWSEGDPSAKQRHEQALRFLDQARELLADDAVDQGAIRRAEGFLREADATVGAANADLDRLIETRRLDLAAKDESVDVRVAAAKAVLERTAYLEPYPRLVEKARADLEGLVAEAARRDAGSRRHLDGLAARLENSTAVLTKLTTPPPKTLATAAAAYLEGRYTEVVAALATAQWSDRRARAHARLLLAASRHELYLEGGELDRELLATAADDARACRHADADLVPSERYFSPRFIAFFVESIASPPTG
jgi:hypothetical protein